MSTTFFVCMASIQIYLFARWLQAFARWLHRTATATGTVVGSRLRTHWSDQYTRARPDVMFVDASGVERTFASSFDDTTGACARWPEGSEVQIEYDPTDNANCELSLSNLSTVYIASVGFLFVCFSFFTFATFSHIFRDLGFF